jgi:hypothetical protein
MPAAKGVSKIVYITREATYGSATAGTARELRRITSTMDMTRDAYMSREILSSQQMRDMRLGTKRPQGAIVGEVAPGSWTEAWQGGLRRNFTTMGTATGSVAVSGGKFVYTGANPSTTFKVGDVVRGTGFGTAANNGLYRISALSASDVTVLPTAVTEAGGSARGLAGIGSKTFIPASGQLDLSYFIEHWFSDVAQSERFVGCKVAQIDINVPPTDMATIQVTFMGKDMQTGTATYAYGAKTAAATNSVLAGANGALSVNGTDYVTITSLQMSISTNLTNDAVVGSTLIREHIPGRVVVQGRLTALFEDATMRDMFLNETDVQLHLLLTDTQTPVPGFFSIFLPKIRLAGGQKDDGEKSILQSFNFSGIENVSASNNAELTTVQVQDSSI